MNKTKLSAKVITLYPEFFPGPLSASVTGRALKNKIWSLDIIDLRQYGRGVHKQVDDKPISGGPGMILKPDVLDEALMRAYDSIGYKNSLTICMSPKGSPLTQDVAKNLLQYNELIIVCGRFEGIDQRVIDYYGFEEISVSDVILNGGEIASQLFIESFMRLQPNVLGNEKTHIEESFHNDLLEHDQFTRPNPWIAPNNKSLEVPLTLTSGHHADIEDWKKENSLENTQKNRPDLFKKYLKKNKNE